MILTILFKDGTRHKYSKVEYVARFNINGIDSFYFQTRCSENFKEHSHPYEEVKHFYIKLG